MPRSARRPVTLLALVCVLVLSACRVDVAVDVTMRQNGSGQVAVTVEVDAAVVDQAPGLADDLRTADLVAAGWTVDGPRATPVGGLVVVLTHAFDTPEQATALLSTLNGPAGPLQAIAFQRTATLHDITYTVSGTGRLDGGLAAFTDTDLVAAVGGVPYTAELAAAGVAPTDAVSVVLRVNLPGEVQDDTAPVPGSDEAPPTSLVEVDPNGATDTTQAGEGADTTVAPSSPVTLEPVVAEGRTLSFPIALDGSDTAIEARTVKSLDRGGGWSLLATVLLIALIVWVLVAIATIVAVGRRQRRRNRAAHRLNRGLYERVLDDTHR
ncbi:MAG: hypothetical protein U0Q03_08555 [Acidimicrobiales bacterium]